MEDFLEYNKYLRKLSKENPQFGIKRCFSIEDEEREEYRRLMAEIDKINDEIKATSDRSHKNALSREKGRILEILSRKILESADIFMDKENLRDHTNEIDVLLTPGDYNRMHSVLLPDYLKDDILVECKNYDKNIKNDWIGKFFSLMTTHKTKVGLLFSYKRFSGVNEWDAARGLVRKLFLAENVFIININFDDIRKHIIDEKMNIVELIISKYEGLKHSVSYKEFISEHPAEIKE